MNSKELAHVSNQYTENTGGGFMCDVFILLDGTVLVIGEESIALYTDLKAWQTNSEGYLHLIDRHTPNTSERESF